MATRESRTSGKGDAGYTRVRLLKNNRVADRVGRGPSRASGRDSTRDGGYPLNYIGRLQWWWGGGSSGEDVAQVTR